MKREGGSPRNRPATADIVLENEERALIAADRRPGGAWAIATARDPEFRSMADQPLPDVWYEQAKRVAATLGQEAATAMLIAEQSRRMALRMAAERARMRAVTGPTLEARLVAALCTLVMAATGAALAYGPITAWAAPWQAHQLAWVFATLVAGASIRAAIWAR